MKALTLLGLTVALAIGLVSAAAAADEVTMSGNIMCAKCVLKKADATGCQDVLVVKDAEGKSTEYYVTKNDVAQKFGHNCKGETAATVTGQVAEKDGKKWITPSKIEKQGEKQG
jgi:hypothetical protein